MTQLSRLATLGLAKEVTVGTYLAPTTFLPFMKADYEDVYTAIKDESYRANDSMLQGLYQGVVEADWGIDIMAYPDISGHFLRGIIGPDTIVAGITTTVATGGSAIGATTLPSTASIPANTYIRIDTGTSLEFAFVTAVSGAGPFNLTVTTVVGQTVGLTKAHLAGAAIVSQSVHTFNQSPLPANKATYSLTVYDTSTGTPTLGYSDSVFSDVQIKIDPKGAVTLSTKLKTFPGVAQSTPTPAFSQAVPELGWEWQMTNGGAASTRGLTLDLTIKRTVDVIHSSNGVQAPREIFQGALEVDGTYKAIFENLLDLNLYTAYTQTPTIAAIQKPAATGGENLTLTMSKSGWYKGKRDLSSDYVQADFSLSGIWNSTDSGSLSATLSNYQNTAY